MFALDQGHASFSLFDQPGTIEDAVKKLSYPLWHIEFHHTPELLFKAFWVGST